MDEIIESIVNGQRKQALRQLDESPYFFSELIESLIERDMIDEVVGFLRAAENNEYIKYDSSAIKETW